MVWEAKWELGELGHGVGLLGGAPVRGMPRGKEQVEFSGAERQCLFSGFMSPA